MIQREKALNSYATIIDQCRDELYNANIPVGQSFEYAATEVYRKILLTNCEIYTLLSNGYPEGALALSRQLFEGWAIESVLLKAYRQNDKGLLVRFFDSIEIFDLKEYFQIIEWVCKESEKNDIQREERKIKKERKKYWEKTYKRKLSSFSSYWWANCEKFDEFVNKAGLKMDYMFRVASNKVHLNILSVFYPLDQSESHEIMGETFNGWQLPLCYTVLCMRSIAFEINSFFPIICSRLVVDRFTELADKLRPQKENTI